MPVVCKEESEQMGEHTARNMQVEGSKGTELTWGKLAKKKPQEQSCPVCICVVFACESTYVYVWIQCFLVIRLKFLSFSSCYVV